MNRSLDMVRYLIEKAPTSMLDLITIDNPSQHTALQYAVMD